MEYDVDAKFSAIFFGIVLALYVIPFAVMVASPGRRSFFVVVSLVAAALFLLWLPFTRVPSDSRNFSYFLSRAALLTMGIGAAAGLVARGVTLAMGWRRFRSLGLATTILALLATPFCLAVAMGYDRWQHRPLTAECLVRPSFNVQMAAERLSVPNWPLVMVSSGDEHYVFSIPTGLRPLCEHAGHGMPTPADSATFFFSEVTFRPWRDGLKSWADRECRDAADKVAASLVCGERPIETLSIYADTDSSWRTRAYGSMSSHAFFARRQADGYYAQTGAIRHPAALEYPDGTWAFDDGTVVKCYMSGNGYPSCLGDIQLAPKLLARVIFNAWHGNVEDAQKKARNAAVRLYTEILRSAD